MNVRVAVLLAVALPASHALAQSAAQPLKNLPDPYEAPTNAEVVIDTAQLSPDEAAQAILLHLERESFLGSEDGN